MTRNLRPLLAQGALRHDGGEDARSRALSVSLTTWALRQRLRWRRTNLKLQSDDRIGVTRAAAGPAANRADHLTYVAETGRRRRLKRNTSNPFPIKRDSRSCQRACSPSRRRDFDGGAKELTAGEH